MRRHLPVLLVALAFCSTACGTSSSAPTVTNLVLTTSPVERGKQASGKIDISDPDGLAGLRLKLSFSGPATVSTETPLQGASASITQTTAPFVFMLTAATPTGSYTLSVTAIDGDGNESQPATATFDLK